MSLEDPALTWFLYLAPRRLEAELPPWPVPVAELFGSVSVGSVDPIQTLLGGPVPERVLARAGGEDGRTFLAGLGRGIAVSASVVLPGEFEREPSLDEFRRRVAALLLGRDPDGSADLEALSEAVVEVWGGSEDWEVLGVAEVNSVLLMGAAEGEESEGWLEYRGLRLARATGVGGGHLAWRLQGGFERDSERQVMARRLLVLREGHLERSSVLCAYGHQALLWGASARRAARGVLALEELIERVRLATSIAVAGGPEPAEGAPDLASLAARLEAMRASLEQELAAMEAGFRAMRIILLRLFGEELPAASEGPFVEASRLGEETADSVRSRLRLAQHWAQALDLARKN